MTHFAFRADAGPAIGFGHLSRCLAIAQAVTRAGGRSTLVSSRPIEAVAKLAEERGLALAAVDADPSSPEDARATLEATRDADVVVVDGYAFDAAYMRALASRFTCYVDDLGRSLPCAAIVNHNFYGASVRYELAADALRLAGPEYGIVADAFVDARARRTATVPERAQKIVVTFGGSDPTNETAKCLAALDTLAGPFDVDAIVGAASPHLDAAKRTRLARHPTRVHVAVSDMAERMRVADLLVTAGGVTCMEAACVGLPAIAVAVADNQRQVVSSAGERGFARALGWHADVDAAALAREIDALANDRDARAAMIDAQHAVVDGKGKDRIVRALAEAAARGKSKGGRTSP